jgi:glutathione S-transferase
LAVSVRDDEKNRQNPETQPSRGGMHSGMGTKITFYTFAPSHNAVRTEIALHEKRLEFDKVSVDLLKGEHREKWFRDITPRGQVPTLVVDSGGDPIVVYESIATIRFLDDMYPEPPLMPPVSEPRRRAQALMRLEEFQAKLDPCNVFGSVVFGKQNREQLGQRVDKLVAEIAQWERYMDGQAFLAGDRFTLADIAVFPLLMHFEALGYDYAGRAPALHAYMQRCSTRPSVVATGWLETFRSFVTQFAPAPVLAE